ncbi:MAG TPA: ATP-binding domain-containing protein [Acidimicrobiales bacterium]|jgi:DNA helicase IV
MTGSEPDGDPELLAEQEYLDRAHVSLATMRDRAAALLVDLRAAGNLDLDYQAALQHRVAVLADSPRPLLFGRIDEDAGPSWHIGRRHVEDQRGDPVVVDWRAPVSVPFYRARVEDALGLTRRRQVMVDRRTVIAVADDLFGRHQGDLSGHRLRGGDALLAELERARTGEMLDIVATIQAEQDEVIRAPLAQLMAVQGGPGTGKTAVGLHRAAFLLYNHPPLARDGVLVLGPSRAFLRYIAQVLPSLGEEAVIQATVADIAPRVSVRADDESDVRRLKGDPRLALLLASALRRRRQPLQHDVTLRARFTRCTLSPDEVNRLADSIGARPAPYKSGRLALRSRLVSLARQKLRAAGRFEVEESWFERELAASDSFRNLLDHLWPSVPPKTLVRDLLSDAAELENAATGLLTSDEWPRLVRPKSQRLGTVAWTIDDLPLLDEAEFLVNGQKRTYGHVVVDEAQDLTPMQFRMVARRAPAGSLTVLGDLAQATGAWSYETWDDLLEHLPATAPVRRDELTLGYRAPGQVLDLASKLLPLAAPTVTPTRSIRRGRREPRIVEVPPDQLLPESLAEATRLSGEDLLVGLIVAAGDLTAMSALVKGRSDVGLLHRDGGIEKPITVVSALAAKGLEFDAVVVAEPAAIAGEDARGLRLLYVALTRPIQHLSIVHAEPLPLPLTR